MLVGDTDEDGRIREIEAPFLTVVPDADWGIGDSYDIVTTPSIVLIDRNGKVAWVFEGYLEGLGVAMRALGLPATEEGE